MWIMRSPDPVDVGRRVRELRERAGLTQDELHARLVEIGEPIARPSLSKIERGKMQLLIERAYAFAQVLGCEVSDFYGEGVVSPINVRILGAISRLPPEWQERAAASVEDLARLYASVSPAPPAPTPPPAPPPEPSPPTRGRPRRVR